MLGRISCFCLLLVFILSCNNKDIAKMQWVQEFVHDGYVLDDGKKINFDLEQGEKIVFLVRHAEKDTVSKEDPNLNELGLKRAELLSEIFKKSRIDVVYSTLYTRTLMTVANLTEAKGLATKVYDPRQLESFADSLKADDKFKTALVVGHSNTTPQLAMHLSGTDEELSINEDEYDNLYVVILRNQEENELKKLLFRPKESE